MTRGRGGIFLGGGRVGTGVDQKFMDLLHMRCLLEQMGMLVIRVLELGIILSIICT